MQCKSSMWYLQTLQRPLKRVAMEEAVNEDDNGMSS